MNNQYYFKHDMNPRIDAKIEALIKKYGIEGYGRFWIVLENMGKDTTYKLEDKEYIWESLAEQMKITVKQTKDFVNDCIEKFELFVKENNFIYSPSFLERMSKLEEIRQKRILAGRLSHSND